MHSPPDRPALAEAIFSQSILVGPQSLDLAELLVKPRPGASRTRHNAAQSIENSENVAFLLGPFS
jgi:hypothetical protein